MLSISSEGDRPPALSTANQASVPSARERRDGRVSLPLDRSQVPVPSRVARTNRTALRSLSPAAQFGYGMQSAQPTRKQTTAPIDGVEALRQAAQKRALQEAQGKLVPRRQTVPGALDLMSHAAPLSPLRERDVVALADWFERNDMLSVESDIDHCLLVLWPAPCWEDDPFEFLQEFL